MPAAARRRGQTAHTAEHVETRKRAASAQERDCSTASGQGLIIGKASSTRQPDRRSDHAAALAETVTGAVLPFEW